MSKIEEIANDVLPVLEDIIPPAPDAPETFEFKKVILIVAVVGGILIFTTYCLRRSNKKVIKEVKSDVEPSPTKFSVISESM